MSKQTIKIGSTMNLQTLALLSHSIETEQFDYIAETVKNIDECTLKMMKKEFDIGEMSLATFLKVQETDSGLKALPIFSRKIPQVYAFCAEHSDLHSYQDLSGKKVAVFQNWVTASIWHRWLLENQYGVDPASIIWCPLRKDRMEDMPYPENYQFNWDYINGDPAELLRSGGIDCFFYARKPDHFEGLRWLFPPSLEEQAQAIRDGGIIPITHVMAIREDLLQNNPDIVLGIMELFEKSKERGYREVGHMSGLYLPFADWHLHETESSFLQEGWNDNGWAKNKKILETFYEACINQGFIEKPYDLSDCFVQLDYEKKIIDIVR
ncbi:substrate-binding domain-containing protein [Domibacillus epiphyticus]|uniref:SsuA/THI5-like domain-containing protein n=1 Tax=Domibacillus epiphyticus TaxID=1714355 RepID=A0A1V2ABU0_9BACI|nr:MqnA/MqnD/SBP family protein [Domibacillus epiphyticus]OMP68430.1 hypothetical protein BTO28_02075 [Domibacillus epiphyticus]